MKQTAVQWLIDQLISENEVVLKGENYKLFEQALAMEKEQMLELWNGGIKCTEEGGKSFDQYHNETYKSNQ